MGFWDALVIIFIVGAMVWLRAQKYRAQGVSPRIKQVPPALPAPGRDQEVEELRKRIAVLERIATDESKEKDLARRIEALRD